MKYILINPETGEEIASVSRSTLQLASILTNEHLFAMLKDHSEQRLIDSVKHNNEELSAAVSGICRDEIQHMSLYDLKNEDQSSDDGSIHSLELVVNDSFLPSDHTAVCKYDLGIVLKALRHYYQFTARQAHRHQDDGDRYWYNRLTTIATIGTVLRQYHNLM